MFNTAYVALGSNLNQPIAQINTALAHLAALPDTTLVKTSPFYQNPPMGPQDQDDFVNAVTQIQTSADAHTLLKQLKTIEKTMGRVETKRWGPRIIDLDLLLLGDTVLKDEILTLPHPGITERIFVLQPLYDIAPHLILPGGGNLASLLMALNNGPGLIENLHKV